MAKVKGGSFEPPFFLVVYLFLVIYIIYDKNFYAMGCNCKKVNKISEKYGDNEELGIKKVFDLVSTVLSRLVIFCLVFALMAVATPIILLYAMGCLVVGKKITLKIPRLKRNVR